MGTTSDNESRPSYEWVAQGTNGVPWPYLAIQGPTGAQGTTGKGSSGLQGTTGKEGKGIQGVQGTIGEMRGPTGEWKISKDSYGIDSPDFLTPEYYLNQIKTK